MQLICDFYAALNANKMHQTVSSIDMNQDWKLEGSEKRVPLIPVSSWLAMPEPHGAWCHRENYCAHAKDFKFNHAFKAGHLIFRLKLLQNSGSVVGPPGWLPSSSNLLTQSLWRHGIYPVLYSSAGTTVCAVSRYYQRLQNHVCMWAHVLKGGRNEALGKARD